MIVGCPSEEMTDAELERAMPYVQWRKPVPLDAGLACKYCISHYGLEALEPGRLSKTPEQFAAHLELTHPTK